ncbi:MAG TPA: beta-phosphoglucomutase family hydrolase [Nocardioidaceae bacterium]|nr:beta-phosphoglucomutase family hydrolase [Nocardioidaceae bacterium]
MTRLGLPESIAACLFDLDGVLTQTAKVHAAAWKETFDDLLRTRSERTGEPFVPFDIRGDYTAYVDGRRRLDGVRAFLASRHIALPEGSADDRSTAETVNGVGNRKNALLRARIGAVGVAVYEGSRRYAEAARAAGLRLAVVSSSANTEQVLAVTGLADLFEVRVDGVVARERSLPGKPAPDMFLYAAQQLGVAPAEAAVFEDALAGVAAGRAGRFGYVVGVDRVGQADELRASGADVVVTDLAELR